MELPADLRFWVGDWGLVVMALDSVQAESLEAGGAGVGCPGHLCRPMMLTLLAYCYAASIYGSEAIELAPDHSAQVRYICAGQYPTADTIRQFRRANRAQVGRCLGRVLDEAWRRKVGERECPPNGEAPSEATARAAIRLLVEQKLQMAVMMDTAAED